MAIYDKSGILLGAAYGKDGSALSAAYDKAGNIIWTAEPISLRVCSYNVGGWYIGSGTNVPADKDATYYALQNGMIADIDADILCLQEYWTQFSNLPRTAESLLFQYYPYIRAEKATTQYFGHAICSKYPILSYTTNHFSVDSTDRYYDMAEIQVGAIVLCVIVTHFSVYHPDWKLVEAEELQNYCFGLNKPFVVCGDFNCKLDDPSYDSLTEAIFTPFVDAGGTIANGGDWGVMKTTCGNTDWATNANAVDNIIASSGIDMVDAATNTAKLTDSAFLADGKIDHIPIYADLTLGT